MAVAAPVLERKVDTDENAYARETSRENLMSAEDRHNSRISSNYAKLINPESTLRDIINKEIPAARAPELFAAPVTETRADSLYLVENARADADIFRADSIVNRKAEYAEAQTDEEENEDLRPTQTTIQYKTAGAASVVEEGKIKTSAKAKRAGLNKRDKIFIAVALTVIIALFTLIIVNSAIISGLSGEVSSLQYNLGTAKEAFMRAQAEKDAYMNDANLFEIVSKFAYSHGMVLK